MTYGDRVNLDATLGPAHRLTARLTAVTVIGGLALGLAGPVNAAPADAPVLTAPAVGTAGQATAGRAPTANAPELAAFYGQALDWSACDDLSCAWLTVPLDYAHPEGQSIRLRIARATATGAAGDRQGSLVVNPGGPGASGVGFTAYVAQAIAPRVAREFDVVGFDTRGVGESEPITCMTGRQTTTWLRADGSPTPQPRSDGSCRSARGWHRGACGCPRR